jgi:hypothetical protein
MRRFLLCLPLLFALGCAKATAPTPPPPPLAGAVNQFDSESYKTLIAVQATITSLNASYKANPTGLASLKPILDQAATDYNLADSLWQAYHAAATAANQAALTAQLTKVQSDLAKVPAQ